MAGQQLLKRIPRIKFPNRRAGEHVSHQVPPARVETESNVTKMQPSPSKNLTVGGKASEQPKRTPVSEKEIEAIMLGGCFS